MVDRRVRPLRHPAKPRAPTTTTTTAPIHDHHHNGRNHGVIVVLGQPGVGGRGFHLHRQGLPVPSAGTVNFFANGAPIAGCDKVAVSAARVRPAARPLTSPAGTSACRRSTRAMLFPGHPPRPSTSRSSICSLPAAGYWLATGNGQVFGSGAAHSLGGVTTSATSGAARWHRRQPQRQGVLGGDGQRPRRPLGDAKFYGDLPDLGKHVSDIVAIAPTTDGNGYYLVGADGGFFTFGDAKFHGSLPGIGLHVKDVVGMVATPGGSGYLLVGSDGGVFTFGTTRFYGSLPGIGKHVHDIRAILPSSTGRGYILVGSDGGAFNFGTGAKFHGSLPGEGIKVSDIVGIALTPDNGGYYMAGTDGNVYGFGDAHSFGEPSALASNLPVAAIAGT